MEKFIAQSSFEDAEMITIDGIRVNYANGWGLVRPSNTTPCLVLRFEANDEDTLKKIQNIFREQMLAVDSSLDLPF
jgi:phosphomannomutase